MNYLNDPVFLKLFDNEKIKAQYVSIVILSFDEKPIREISGTISQGSINVNGGSAVRRTLSLTMNATEDTNKLTNLNNIISINKKIKVAVGYKNYFNAYKHYGDILWFPCGLFVIEKSSISRSTTGYSVSINGKDKMALLDGTAGGVLPASVTFHERYEIDDDENITVSKPTIYQIIQEAVNHYGNEPLSNIFINDLEQTAKMLVRWQGDEPFYLDPDTGQGYITSWPASDIPNYGEGSYKKYIKGQDIGYLETDMTYPGNLILNAGETVVSLLDKINNILGKTYEYFYTIDGKFIFQKIKDYSTQSYTPLSNANYMKSFNESKYTYSFTNSNTIISTSYNPAYDKIKNDFIVWGSKEISSGYKVGIRYHLAIDEKPRLDLSKQYMWKIKAENSSKIINYVFTESNQEPSVNVGFYATLLVPPAPEWREELYRRALLAETDASAAASHYDVELLAEWRNLFDPSNEEWAKQTGERQFWNPDVFENPSALNYWLDFIDASSSLGEYSVNKIGRRSLVQKNDKISSVYQTPVPDVIFVNNQETTPEQRAKFQENGQKFCLVNSETMNYFSTSATGISAFDQIRELLYQHLVYNMSVNITCIPRFYFEPNTLIHVEDRETGVIGNLLMKQFTLPLTYNGTMSITANEAVSRI